MHSKDKARILKDLTSGYCEERKSTVKEVGAAQDYFTLNFICAISRLTRVLPRSEVIAVINEWAGYEKPQSQIEAEQRLFESNARWKKLVND